MAEFKDLVTASEQYAAAQKDLNNQLAEMKANLASMGISVDSIKATELMTYFANDNYNHSIEPVPFQIGTKSSGDPLYGVSSQPLTADLVNEGLKFRNPQNPSEILTGTYKPYAATAIYTFELKDMNQSEASFSFHYPTLVGMPDATVYPKEIVFLGPDGQFMLYRNSNFGIGMMYGTDNSKMTNFVVKKQRYWWNGDPYMSTWSSKQGESLSYYDHSTKRMTLLFPDEAYCMEMLDTEWQVYTCFDYTAPTGSLEPKTAPTYKWVGSELSVSGMIPADYYRNLQIVDEKVKAIKNDKQIVAISDNLFNTSYTRYDIGGIDIHRIFSVSYSWSNAPYGVTLPASINKLNSGDIITVDSTYNSNTAKKDEVNNCYYQFSGWDQSGNITVNNDIIINGSWSKIIINTNWTEGTISSSSSNRTWSSICYGNGKFVAVARNSKYFAYSTDGMNWTEGTISSTDIGWGSVCYGNGKYVAIAEATTGGGSKIFAYSTNGIKWTEGMISSSRFWGPVCYGNGKFITISFTNTYYGSSNNCFAYSTDGITWTEGTISSSTTDRGWRSICYGNNKFITVDYISNHFAYSTDGITWTEGTISDTNRKWYSVCYGNDKFVAVTNYDNTFAYSTDGITWTESIISSTNRGWTSVCYGNGKFVAVAYNSNIFAYSIDGINWTESTISNTIRYWNSVCYGNDKFVAVASSNIFAYSNWFPDINYID